MLTFSEFLLLESEDADPTSEVDSFRKRWQAAGVDNHVFYNKNRNMISLSSIIVPREHQNKGIGSQYMRELTNLGDRHGATVHLTPATDWGASKTRLQKFYRNQGFVDNKGRNKDFTISDAMYRRPQRYTPVDFPVPQRLEQTEKPLPPIRDTITPLARYSDEFRRRIDGTKVADPHGNPINVYHGTPDIAPIRKGGFRDSDDGIFFTNDPATASTYANDKRAVNYQDATSGIIHAHLHMTNPLIHDHQGKDWEGTREIIEKARKAGHDGIIIRNVIDRYNTPRTKKVRPSNVYAVFKGNQVHIPE